MVKDLFEVQQSPSEGGMRKVASDHLWGSFVERVLEVGWDRAIGDFETRPKTASYGDVRDGLEMIEQRVAVFDQIPQVRGWFDMIKVACDAERGFIDVPNLCKVVLDGGMRDHGDADYSQGVICAAQDLLETGCEMAKLANEGPMKMLGAMAGPGSHILNAAKNRMGGMVGQAAGALQGGGGFSGASNAISQQQSVGQLADMQRFKPTINVKPSVNPIPTQRPSVGRNAPSQMGTMPTAPGMS